MTPADVRLASGKLITVSGRTYEVVLIEEGLPGIATSASEVNGFVTSISISFEPNCTVDFTSSPPGEYRSPPFHIRNRVEYCGFQYEVLECNHTGSGVEVERLLALQRLAQSRAKRSKSQRAADCCTIAESIEHCFTMLGRFKTMHTVTVSSKFQVVIPRAARESLGIEPGHLLYVLVDQGRIEFVPLQPIRKMRGFLKRLNTSVPRERDRL